ncbi:hypothetical protein GCM10027176_21550 [Actinoallomurus bryophytorum]|uniref:Uncharacterized protein n=1 Tax=Actinoallomurus bryophytorum TaxID=1490222 RepID=A0A543CKE7_9ACTN|nr:hypothetical protein [Actinoallomurus bryophytorum]TQL97576.1 hypothetical protein FB559_3170 [Actinoallomurus bryophytorum]
MSESPELVRQLLKAVVAYTWFFERCDESVLEDRIALKQMEYAAHLLSRLSPPDRQRSAGELAEMAADETDPEFREFIAGFANAMGLVDDA